MHVGSFLQWSHSCPAVSHSCVTPARRIVVMFVAPVLSARVTLRALPCPRTTEFPGQIVAILLVCSDPANYPFPPDLLPLFAGLTPCFLPPPLADRSVLQRCGHARIASLPSLRSASLSFAATTYLPLSPVPRVTVKQCVCSWCPSWLNRCLMSPCPPCA